MSQETLQDALRKSNVPVIANAIELGAEAIMKVAGNAISNTVDGKLVTPAFVHAALASRLQSLSIANVKTQSEG